MPRESEPKRHHSRFDREPSPKRSRRNGKPTMERSPNRLSPEVRDKDDDRKHGRRLPDPLHLDNPHASNYKSKHDDRSNAGQDGTSTGRAGKFERGWWRSHEDDRRGKHQISSDAVEKDDKSNVSKDDRRVQSHNEPSKRSDLPQPTKKKFREEKLPPTELQPAGKDAPEPANKREERAIHRHPDRNEHDRSYGGGRVLPNRARTERGGFPSRDRHRDGIDANNRFRGRDGHNGRLDYRTPGGGDRGGRGGRADKWKHDMFDEVNRSPSKNEDPVAKAEALLA